METRNAFFTADTHFYHKNILTHCNRPFTTVEEMNNVIVDNWNAVVGPKDVVYVLGDFSFGTKKETRIIRARLNGSICLITGNHDEDTVKLPELFEWIKPYYELEIPEEENPFGIQIINLFHYPMREWNRRRYDVWALYGHCHKKCPPYGKSFDVGVDGNDFRPWSYQQVKAYMATRPTWE